LLLSNTFAVQGADVDDLRVCLILLHLESKSRGLVPFVKNPPFIREAGDDDKANTYLPDYEGLPNLDETVLAAVGTVRTCLADCLKVQDRWMARFSVF